MIMMEPEILPPTVEVGRTETDSNVVFLTFRGAVDRELWARFQVNIMEAIAQAATTRGSDRIIIDWRNVSAIDVEAIRIRERICMAAMQHNKLCISLLPDGWRTEHFQKVLGHSPVPFLFTTDEEEAMTMRPSASPAPETTE